MDVTEFAWDDGRITSHGRFAAVPVATVARLAGRPLPMRTTLTFGGEWALAGTYVAEAWPEDRRKMGAGYLQTGY